MAVELGPGFGFSATAKGGSVLFREHDPPLYVDVEVQDVRGVPQVVGLWIRSQSWRRLSEGPLRLPKGGTKKDERDLRRYFARMAESDPEPAVITSDLLRALPLRELRDAVLAYRRDDDALDELRGPRRVGRSHLSQPHFSEVASVYKKALAQGRPPLRAVERHFNVKRSTASKYVKGARSLKLLGHPAGPGLAGDSKSKKGAR